MTKQLRLYLVMWAVLMAGAALELAFIPGVLGRASAWGAAPGWQREVAIWNVGMLVVVAGTLRSENAHTGRLLAGALVVLNLLFGTNHLQAVLSNHQATLNGLGAVVNYIFLALGVIALLREHNSNK